MMGKAIPRIQKDLPDAKFIWMVCDPVRRAVSDYIHVRHGQAGPMFLKERKLLFSELFLVSLSL